MYFILEGFGPQVTAVKKQTNKQNQPPQKQLQLVWRFEQSHLNPESYKADNAV